MWNIIICDSDATFSRRFGEVVQEFYRQKDFEVNLKWYPTGAAFAEESEGHVNLAFINTRLDDMKGYSLAEMMIANKSRALLIFLSDHDEDVFEAFRYRPFRYMRKALWETETGGMLDDLWREEHRDRSILIRRNRGDIVIRLDDIIYMESRGHYVHIHCIDRVYQIREKLSVYKEMLRGRYFIHPAKSFLVNCVHIESFGTAVQLKNGEQLNCSKSRKHAAEQLHQQYLEEIAHSL